MNQLGYVILLYENTFILNQISSIYFYVAPAENKKGKEECFFYQH